jgi:hypothetical protein
MRVFVHGAAATPAPLIDALSRRADLADVTLYHLHTTGPAPFVNAALEIDLSGQVVADSIGFRIYSGIGGQMDFIRGAALSPGGVPIIALPSTAAGGRVSRIVPMINPGAGVVTTRGHVHWVVTEYGAVDLFGKTLRERAELLVGIAHPDFRVELRKAFTAARHVVLRGPSFTSDTRSGTAPLVFPQSAGYPAPPQSVQTRISQQNRWHTCCAMRWRGDRHV